MAKTIYQRIALQGGEQLRKELAEFGEVGEKAFRDLQNAVTKTQAPFDKLLAQLAKTQKQMMSIGKSFTDTGRNIQQVGRNISTYVTAPILGVGAAILKVSGDFEAGVNNFAVNTGVVGEELDKAKEKAKELGAASVFSTTEAIDAMTELAKVGRSYEEIMGGAADATLALAAANGGELAPSAAIIGDVMNQFGLEAKDLKQIVDNISGTLVASKLDFDGYRMALGQAGGVAGALGMELEDFNAILATTASSFGSGSDAATSLKTFIQRLVPQTKEAAAVFEELGLNFFDANGNMLDAAKIAEQLRTKLARLSEKDLNAKLTKAFGSDAIRTATALMKGGGAAITEMKRQLDETDSTAMAEARMKGFNGELEKLKGSLLNLGIAIGDSGLLEFATDLVASLTKLVDELAKTNPDMLKFGVQIAAVAAVVGPALIAIGLLTSGIGGLITGVGRSIGALGALLGALRTISLFFVANPWAAAIAVIAAGIALWATRTSEATAAMDTHKTLVDEVKAAYDAAGQSVANMSKEIKDRLAFDALASLDGLKAGIAETTTAFQKQIDLIGAEAADSPLAPMIDEFKKGEIGITELINKFAEFAVAHPELAADLKPLQDSAKAVEEQTKALAKANDIIDLFTGKIDDATYKARRAAAEGFEVVTKAADATTTAVKKTNEEIEKVGKTVAVHRGTEVQLFDIDPNTGAAIARVTEEATKAATAVDDVGTKSDTTKPKVEALGNTILGTTTTIVNVKEALGHAATEITNVATATDAAVVQLAAADASTGELFVNASNNAAGLNTVIDQTSTAVGGLHTAIETTSTAIAGLKTTVADVDTTETANAMVTPFKTVATAITSIMGGVGLVVRTGFAALSLAISSMTTSISSSIDRLLTKLRAAAAEARALQSQTSSSSSARKAGGGYIRGPGTSISDSIPAWLSDGEFVMRTAAVRKYGVGFMAMLNSMRLPLNLLRGFNAGGLARSLSSGLQVPRFAGGGAVTAPAGSGFTNPVSLNFQLANGGQQTFVVMAQPDAPAQMVEFARNAARNSTGRSQSWKGRGG